MSKLVPWVKFEEIDKNSGRFVISPLERGMGNTIGNALRRVLVSSLSGVAVTFIKIEGITHEFTSIPNVVEDVLDVICNIKGVIFKYDGDDPVTVTLSAKGVSKLTAGDIDCSGSGGKLTIVNKKHHIVELSGKGSLLIEMTLERGIGYQAAVMEKGTDQDVHCISIDASFSPVIKVNYSIDNLRVGESLDHESLTLDVSVNGSISAENAVERAANILTGMFCIFDNINQKPEDLDSEPEVLDSEMDETVMDMSIDDIELSARSSNCLKRAGIETVGELVSKEMTELIQIKNISKKSADEINGKLSQYNLALKVD